jgi:predicted GNAT family acetyltransferase
MAEAESGINPLETDPEGFRKRCARRIQQGRTWVLAKDGVLIFKADIQSETQDITYLEGVWVNPQLRGRDVGLTCLKQLEQTLLERTSSVCLLVNEQNQEAQTFYRRAGYSLHAHYDTIFL